MVALVLVEWPLIAMHGSFSEVVIKLIKRDDQETIIFELEGLAVATALQVFGTLLKGKRVVIFTDNQSVQSSLVKCSVLPRAISELTCI